MNEQEYIALCERRREEARKGTQLIYFTAFIIFLALIGVIA